MYLIFLLFNILNTCACIHNPPKDIKKEEIIVLIFISKLDKDKYFKPCVISKRPNKNL